jgi:site-specific recombinase XerD
MNTSVKVILYTSKTLSSGEHPVMLRIIKERKVKYLSVGFSCTKELWDEREGGPKKRHPLYKEAQLSIQKKKLEASRMVMDMENEDRNLSVGELKGKLKRARSASLTLLHYFDLVIERLKGSGQIKNAAVYRDTKNNVSEFTRGKDKQFSEIDVAFLSQLEEYLKASGKGPNTISIYLRTLRALINKAIKEEVCPEKYYAFKKFSLGKYQNIKTAKRAISKGEIEKIRLVSLKKYPELTDARNLFLFSYYCRGMNFTDMASLKWKDIQDGRVNYVRQKTKERFSIALLPPAKEIVEHYSKGRKYQKSDYVFPILNEGHLTPVAIYNRKEKMLSRVNADLKKLATLSKVKVPLTTYVARHSFATILKRQGVNTSLISEMMGHDSEKTTQVYLDSFENKVLDEISKGLL